MHRPHWQTLNHRAAFLALNNDSTRDTRITWHRISQSMRKHGPQPGTSSCQVGALACQHGHTAVPLREVTLNQNTNRTEAQFAQTFCRINKSRRWDCSSPDDCTQTLHPDSQSPQAFDCKVAASDLLRLPARPYVRPYVAKSSSLIRSDVVLSQKSFVSFHCLHSSTFAPL